LNARELARWLSAPRAGWEVLPDGFRFPSESEHLETRERLGVRASDPITWSREYLQQLRQDRERWIARRASSCAGRRVEPATPASADRHGEGVAGPTRHRLSHGGLSDAHASSASQPERDEAGKPGGGRG
jgi:hypothetical protein